MRQARNRDFVQFFHEEIMRTMRIVSRLLILTLATVASAVCDVPARAQSLTQDLKTFAEIPAVPGYEQQLAGQIRARLAKYSPHSDNLGNVWITLGSGSPHRLIVAPMDEPGYIVSGITDDGYLRVQRLPQAAPNRVFDLLYAAQPVLIGTRSGKWVAGVFAGLSTHLQPNRLNPPNPANLDDVYVDIGATSPAGVRAAGVDLLDPIAGIHTLYSMGFDRATSIGIGDRFGCAALTELVRHLDASKLRGSLSIAFVTQSWAGSRGLDRLLQELPADELIYVARLLPRRLGGGRNAAVQAPREPEPPEGSGVLIATTDASAPLAGFAGEVRQLAEDNRLHTIAADAAPLVAATARGPAIPQRFAHIGIATPNASTPAEFIDLDDLASLVGLLKAYVGGEPQVEKFTAAEPLAPPALPEKPKVAPSTKEVIARLTEAYGVSEHEEAVRATVERLLPPWDKTATDSMGNLWLHLDEAASPKTAPIVFVAHMDEIGYQVTAIDPDGRLQVRTRGGGIAEFFSGHAMFVHAASGIRPGVLELPENWQAPNFEWPRGGRAAAAAAEGASGPAGWRVDVGARSPAEVEQLGIKVGDTLTVPKKYRPLSGDRANARSFDDRVGDTALIEAAWALGPHLPGRNIYFIWSVQEELGLNGARAAADQLAKDGHSPDVVFAIDTFVSSDSPLESHRFADAPIGHGFVIRAVDNSNIAPRKEVDRLIAFARAANIPVQYGVTGGGNDGSTFLRHGAIDLAIAWPLRYSHSPGEVIDLRDLRALSDIVAAISRRW